MALVILIAGIKRANYCVCCDLIRHFYLLDLTSSEVSLKHDRLPLMRGNIALQTPIKLVVSLTFTCIALIVTSANLRNN